MSDFLLPEPPVPPELLREGLYPMRIVEAGPRQSKRGMGYFLFTLEIIYPSVHAGRRVFFLYNSSAEAQRLRLPDDPNLLPSTIGREFVGKVICKHYAPRGSYGLREDNTWNYSSWINEVQLRYEI